MAGKPPLGLAVEITTADGVRFQWGKGSNVAGDVPQNLGFSTRLGDGFADGSVTLARRIDRDWPDISLYDNAVFYGADGTVAYEGRIGANPRSVSATHSMSVVTAGWMAHTRDRKMREIYVDRDLSKWQGAGVSRQIATANTTTIAPTVSADPTSGLPALQTAAADTWASTALPSAEGWYDAGVGLALGSLYYAWMRGPTVVSTDTNWTWIAGLADDDIPTTSDATANLRAAGPATGTITAAATNRRFAFVQLRYATAAGIAGTVFPINWTCLAAYGNHGLTKQGTADATNAQGFYASDVIRDIITRFCPQLNADGVQDTTYVIPHLVFDDPTDPFDAISEVNKYHRWQFGVWENKTFHYGPSDLDDYDWAVDLYDPGVTVQLQGDSTDDGAFNGICVNYSDLQTGSPGRVTPDTHPELADLNPENPANRHGIAHWDEISLTSPTTSDGAVQIGRAALAEKNSPKGQGSITIRGHVKDRAGHWQQGWKVRAGDRVAITSSTSLSDRPRLISETSWDQDSLTLTLSVESIPQRVDALFDRLSTALAAAGLG